MTNSLASADAKRLIKLRRARICVVGLGTVGLPLASIFARSGFAVVGYDVDKHRLDSIKSGQLQFAYHRTMRRAFKLRRLELTSDPATAMKDSGIIIVCVPTPISSDGAPQLSIINDVAERTGRYMRNGSLVIIESTVPIGTTRNFAKKVESISGLLAGRDFWVAHCPERYDATLVGEGAKNSAKNNRTLAHFRYETVARVVGGLDETSVELAAYLYSQIVRAEIRKVSSLEVAEAAKLVENAFRDVNIALVNDLARFFPKLGVDTFEAIEAAKTKPFGFLAHYPGPGVGGECIPVVPWFIIRSAEQVGSDAKLLRTAREINDSMPAHVVEIIEEELAKSGKSISSSKIVLLGLTYKRNTADSRLSPGLKLVQLLREKKAEVAAYDPILDIAHPIASEGFIRKVFSDADAVVLVTDHDEFRRIRFRELRKVVRTPIIIDTRNFFGNGDPRLMDFRTRVLGRPNGSGLNRMARIPQS